MEGQHFNAYFPGGAIGMAQALYNEIIEYSDGKLIQMGLSLNKKLSDLKRKLYILQVERRQVIESAHFHKECSPLF